MLSQYYVVYVADGTLDIPTKMYVKLPIPYFYVQSVASLRCELCVSDHYLAEIDNFHPETAVEQKAQDGS